MGPHPFAVPGERLVLVGGERAGSGEEVEVFVQFRPGVRGAQDERDRQLYQKRLRLQEARRLMAG